MEVNKFVEESVKMSRFKHAHVMGLIGVCLDAGPAPYIVMPYMANGSLLHYLKRQRENLVLTESADDDEVNNVVDTIEYNVYMVYVTGTGSSQASDGDVLPDC